MMMNLLLKPVLLFALLSVARGAQPAAASVILHDLAHGETALVEPFKQIATKRGAAVKDSKTSLTAEALVGVRLLYLRAPSKEFTESERKSIVDFVRAGGSLLLVLDEEERQSLAVTRVNELISPFGLKLTPDLPYLHNCGGLAKAGAINGVDREIPYSGGRAVEGGTPFAFVLGSDGKPAQAFASSKTLPNGAKVVVIGEGMASLFLGKPEGVRLSGVPHDPAKTTYWGKDSAAFMDELVTWFFKP